MLNCLDLASVFPMGMGVIPSGAFIMGGFSSVPHWCGGDPKETMTEVLQESCSPRRWGCLYKSLELEFINYLFPTGVG